MKLRSAINPHNIRPVVSLIPLKKNKQHLLDTSTMP